MREPLARHRATSWRASPGSGLEKTGVIAGMSGSPVYLDGRLAGAVAFGWPFANEAIAGITPIETMRGISGAAPRTDSPARPR